MNPGGARIDRRAAAGFLIGLALATTSPYADFRPVPGREYHEVLNATNRVRGEAVVALVLAPTVEAQQADTIRVRLPASYSGELRVQVLSADGRFRGEGSFSGSRGDDRWVGLRLGRGGAKEQPPADPPRPVSTETLALSVRGADGTLYVARWGGESPAAHDRGSLRIYVNSGRADIFIVPGATRAIHCRSLTIAQPLCYDSYCDVPLADIPPDGKFKLIRRDQFEEQTQAFSVYLPRE